MSVRLAVVPSVAVEMVMGVGGGSVGGMGGALVGLVMRRGRRRIGHKTRELIAKVDIRISSRLAEGIVDEVSADAEHVVGVEGGMGVGGRR